MKIAPSILDADFANLQAEIDSIATADRIHLDVMDGQYVPNSTLDKFNLDVLEPINFPIETEAHLMVDHPDTFFDAFCALGVSGITFHIENTRNHAAKLLQKLKGKGVRAGICIDGYTGQEALFDEVLALADQVLCMSVKAGKGGQSFMPEVLEKIKTLRDRGFTGEIEIDGGVNTDNAIDLQKAGADIVVAGSFIVKKPVSERATIIKAFQKI